MALWYVRFEGHEMSARAPRSSNLCIIDAIALIVGSPRTKGEISTLLDVEQKTADRIINALADRKLVRPVGTRARTCDRGPWAIEWGWIK